MAEALTISNAPLPFPGMDYAFLRQEGIKLIAKLAGDHWTDYNTHDPGITILEAWCYALTDLSYRLDFAMEELLALPPGESPSQLFLTARESLTTAPLTINDYRKLLIDIDGVKNAWLEPILEPAPALYYDAKNAKLTFSNLDSLTITDPVHLRGLYRVLLEADNNLPTDVAEGLVPTAKAKLHQYRNLCEDFADIQLLNAETITVHADLEIADYADPHQLLAQLYVALEQVIAPTLTFLTLSELLATDTPVEAIFVGPPLDHGFIDDDQLHQYDRQTELRTSDLIHVILDLEAVKTVKAIALSSSGSSTLQPWALDLNPELTPRLKPFRALIEDLTLYKGQIPCPIDPVQAEVALATLQTPQSPPQSSVQDLPIPAGDYRELADYESLQSEFPLVYGIGDLGLPPSASPQRQAQAKQLQAYLLVFDQLLANYFAQLDHVRSLFTPDNADLASYFTQSIAHFPGAEAILSEPGDYLSTLQESSETARDRRNRFLEHLAAQYGESFIDYSLLYGNNTLPDAAIAHKAAFNAQYQSISAGRSQGFNYLLAPNQIENVSGLKRRVAHLLGIVPQRRSLKTNDKAATRNVEGFYVIEHILLRPRSPATTSNRPSGSGDLLSFSKPITAYQYANSKLICTSAGHGLVGGEQVNLLYSSYYNGTYTVLTEDLTSDTFILSFSNDFVADYTPEQDAWVRQNQHPDPFSFQVSIVLPKWPQRFGTESFRQLVYDTLTAEIPAHVTLQLHWLNAEQMSTFEVMHDLWLQHLSGTANEDAEAQAAAGVAANQLIDFLGLGSTDIPAIPALLGYMTISGADEDTPPPEFSVS